MSIIPDQEAWKRKGLCHGCSPSLFIPSGGRKKVDQATREAKRICEGCPVRPDCLKSSLSRRDEVGIWGGTDEKERRKIRRELGL